MSNMDTLNKELKNLTEICMRLRPWVEGGLLDERRRLTEESNQIERGNKAKILADEAEDKLRQIIQSQDIVKREIEEEKNRAMAERHSLWIKAQSRFKEVEKRIDEADRRVIKGMIKELEAVA